MSRTPKGPQPEPLPPHPATVAQRRSTPWRGDPRPPHPATRAVSRQGSAQASSKGSSTAQRANTNVEATFKTSKGSTYTVSGGIGHTRQKYYEEGVSDSSDKNIFYGSEQTTGACQDARNFLHFKRYKITPAGFGTVNIQFFDRQESCYYSATLQVWPQKGLYPIDMVLKSNGEGKVPDDRFHIGDKIV